jgi:hypothetical protein
MTMKKIDITNEEKAKYEYIWNELESNYDEKSKRLLAAAMAKSIGYGGKGVAREITKLNPDTIKLGVEQLSNEAPLDNERIRNIGGGRKPITEIYPDIEEDLLKLVETNTKGDPESPLLWTTKSLENLSKELKNKGYSISLPTISYLLDKNGYSMQANKKRFEGINKADSIIEKYPDIEEKLLKIVGCFNSEKNI